MHCFGTCSTSVMRQLDFKKGSLTGPAFQELENKDFCSAAYKKIQTQPHKEKHLNIYVITRNSVFSCTHVLLDAFQDINSNSGRAVHYIVISSLERTEC